MVFASPLTSGLPHKCRTRSAGSNGSCAPVGKQSLEASLACLVRAYVSEEDVEGRLPVLDEGSGETPEVLCDGKTGDKRERKLCNERRVQPLEIVVSPEDKGRLVVQLDGDLIPAVDNW
jgi:hypothetical protein